MNQQTKDSLTSVISSVLMILAGIPAVATFIPHDTMVQLQASVPGVLGAVSTLIMFGTIVYKMLPHSKEAKIALARDLPEVSQIVTTKAIADGPTFAADKTVVSYETALQVPVPVPPVPGK